ncbi:uncharacterized protein LOC123872017 [Maniola jurtina]|uniref:uncharacterized protein LOC123872017 n=1 Tax=Maniola jurtina TaxID=191418 RepID=UPI001E68AA65|nr:uncharacterized protein LOC123872017 [Maniola jurtina]
MRVVRQLAEDSIDRYPLAANEATHHMYMDDYINSIDGFEKAKETYHEMVDMFNSGGFNLTKWISNDTKFLNEVPSSHKNPHAINFDSDAQDVTKIVGMQWHPKLDTFTFKINAKESPRDYTKRLILSITARLFDPIGLIGPVTAFMKLLVQECWKLNLDWDTPVPSSIAQQFEQFCNELPHLEQIKIPRYVGMNSESHVTLIGFSDASERCYGAAVYIRVSSDEHSSGSVHLLASKSRVAPLKKTSLARLELCASLLLASLIDLIRETLSKRCKINNIYAFSDATVALSWLHSPAYKYHTFVANRITEINSKLSAEHWYHIKGRENPADIISRPVTPKELLERKLWFNAPQWTTHPISRWPITPFQVNAHNENFEEAKITVLAVETSVSDTQHPIDILAERSSSWSKLLRTIVYMLRFSKRKLDELYTLIQSNAYKNFIENRLAEHRIQFKHSPPYGPHFNGLSEINVRCVKTHLYKVVGTQILTYEELNTIIIQIENLLNSRPLCILSSDPSDLSALTPNHFLNLTPAKYLPFEDLTDIPDSRLSRYQLLTKITCSFWKRWSQEYLTSLQHRQKWNTPSNPVSLGAVVVIKDSNVHPLCWPLGVIEELYPGKDSIIRAVKVRTRSGSYIRPVVRICPLPSQ